MPDVLNRLTEAIVEGEDQAAGVLAREAVDSGVPITEIIENAVARAGEEVGRRFETGKAYLPELLLAGEAMAAVMEVVRPLVVRPGESDNRVPVVIGTVEGDIHDIGKNIVAMMLEGAGFKIIDLGCDVPAKKFAVQARFSNAKVIAMSALISTTMVNMERVVEELKELGIRDEVIVMVGGAPVTEEFTKKIGADLYARNAGESVSKLRAAMHREVA